MRTFLVEAYFARSDGADLVALAERAGAVARRSPAIRYLGSLVVSEDEICLHLFEAPSLGALLRATAGGDLARDRVVETAWLPAAFALEPT